MTLAPILIGFSFRLDSDQYLIGSSITSVRRKAFDNVRHIVGIENPDFVPAPGSTATSAPSATIFLIVSGVSAACGSPACSRRQSQSACYLPPAPTQTTSRPGTGRLAADDSTIAFR